MIITICEGYNDTYFILTSKNLDFKRKFDDPYIVTKWENTYKVFSEISDWCNNELGEECLFEVD